MTRNPRTPEDALISRCILILSNVLRRGAALRYRRLLDISVAEWAAIAELGVRAPCTINQLASGLALDKTRLSRTVTELARRGFVRRRLNPDDNRESLISLTPAGEKARATILASAAVANELLLEGLCRSEREAILNTIDALTTKARAVLEQEQLQDTGERLERRAASAERVVRIGRREARTTRRQISQTPSSPARQNNSLYRNSD